MMMFDARKLPMVVVAIALGLGMCISDAQAVLLGGESFNDGSGNASGLTYGAIGEAGNNKGSRSRVLKQQTANER